MGGLGKAPTLPQAPVSPDASDEAFLAARRARGFSLFALSNGYAANFRSGSDLQPANTDKGPVSYGLPNTMLTSGQIGDDTGTSAPPDLREGAKPTDWLTSTLEPWRRGPGPTTAIDPNDPNAWNPNNPSGSSSASGTGTKS